MAIRRLPLLAAAVVGLGIASPASAVSGFGVSAALRSGHAVTIAVTRAKNSKAHTCQATSNKRERTAAKATVIGTADKMPVVACEQPPRSEIVTPSLLNKATASALATLG